MHQTQERRVPLAGSFNFRDLGGRRTRAGREVRRGRLFRSDALHRLTAEDLVRLQSLGIATIVDLRTSIELEQTGLGLLHADEGTTHRHVPYWEVKADSNIPQDSAALTNLYAGMVDNPGACLADVFSILADERSYPAVVHCAVGKDRTGLVSAVILRTLGVPDDEIIADYAESDANLGGHVADLRRDGLSADYDAIPPHLLRAEPETLASALAHLDRRHPSIEAYLSANGVAAAHVERVRHMLLSE